LDSSDLISKKKDGYWAVTNTHLTAGGENQKEAVRKFQIQLMQLGIDSLGSIPRHQRDISTVTITINQREIGVIQERIQAFRQELFRIADECENDDTVMQLNVQLFPLAIVSKGSDT
jgi:uncharacterized protein (TIGR02147 family)